VSESNLSAVRLNSSESGDRKGAWTIDGSCTNAQRDGSAQATRFSRIKFTAHGLVRPSRN